MEEEIANIVSENRNLTQEIENIREVNEKLEVEKIENRNEDFKKEIEELQNENERLRREIYEKDLENKNLNINLGDLQKNLVLEVEKIENRNEDFKKEIEELQNENERLRREIYEKDLENKNLNINLGDLQKTLETNLSINNSLKADLEKKSNEYELTLHKAIESYDIKDKTLAEENNNLRLHIDQINKQNYNLEQELAQIRSQYEEKLNEMLTYKLQSDSIANIDKQGLTGTIQLLNEQLSEYKNTSMNYSEEILRLNTINNENDTKVKLKEAQIKDLENKLNELEERNNTMKNNLDDNTSYFHNIHQKLLLFCQKREIQLNCDTKKPEELLNFVIQIAEEKYDIELKLNRELSIYKKSIHNTYDILSNFFKTFEYNRIIIQELQQPNSSMELEIRTLLEDTMQLQAIEEEEEEIKKISTYVKYMEYLLNSKYKNTENILEVFTNFMKTIIEMLNITFENITTTTNVVSPIDILRNTSNNIIKEIQNMRANNETIMNEKSNEFQTIMNENALHIQNLNELFTLCISEFKVIFNIITTSYYKNLANKEEEEIIQDIAIIEQKNEMMMLDVENFKILISKIANFIKSSFNYLTEQENKLNDDISYLRESVFKYETNFSDVLNYLKYIIDNMRVYQMESKDVEMTTEGDQRVVRDIKYYINLIIHSKDKYSQQLCYEKCAQLFDRILNIFDSSSSSTINDSVVQSAFNDCDEAVDHYSNVISTIYDDRNESYKSKLKLYYANLLDVRQLLLDDDNKMLLLGGEEEEDHHHHEFLVLFDEIKNKLHSWMKITNSIREKEIALYDMIQKIQDEQKL